MPFWIQALVWELVQNPGRSRPITNADVENAYRDRILGNAGRHYFQPFEERLNREDPAVVRGAQRVLTHLSRVPVGKSIARASLAAVFAEVSGHDAPEFFDGLFADLQSDFYIHYDHDTDQCVFAHKVLKDWWLRWHPTVAATASTEEPDGN